MNGKIAGRLGTVGVTALATAAIGLSGALPVASSGNVVPKAGAWKVTILRGGAGGGGGGSFTISHVYIGVSANHKQAHFSFSYSYTGPIKPPAGSCSRAGTSAAAKASTIKNGRFSTPGVTSWSGAGSAVLNAVFGSARKAHGTAKFSVFISGIGCQFSGMANSGTATWKATH